MLGSACGNLNLHFKYGAIYGSCGIKVSLSDEKCPPLGAPGVAGRGGGTCRRQAGRAPWPPAGAAYTRWGLGRAGSRPTRRRVGGEKTPKPFQNSSLSVLCRLCLTRSPGKQPN